LLENKNAYWSFPYNYLLSAYRYQELSWAFKESLGTNIKNNIYWTEASKLCPGGRIGKEE
jgi:hypothetical protein